MSQTKDFSRLSVVVPSFQQGEFIEHTIRNIIDQDHPNLDLILLKCLLTFASRSDPRPLSAPWIFE